MSTIDIEGALNLLGGYKNIYERFVKSFIENQSQLIEELEAALESDLETARRLVHTCKGLAPNLGAFTFHELCKEYEQAIINRDRDLVEAYHIQFKNQFQAVMAALKAIDFNAI